MAARTQIGNQRSESEDALAVQRDHDAIAGLADDLLPALIAKLAASGLGEIEVRQGGWKARLRMPAPSGESRRGAAKPVDSHDSHDSHGHTPPARGSAVHTRPEDRHAIDVEDISDEPARVAAKSPAVGIYNPRKDLAVGMPVRSGDRIGQVNVLGVNQDVVSPVDGVIGSSLAEAGEAVEYGQELVRIELPEPEPPTSDASVHAVPVGAAGQS
jgi:biotin carboxyl carrier protein